MIIGIDANEANITHRAGVGQFAFHILSSLAKLPSSHQFHLYLKDSPLPDLPPPKPNWHYHIFGPKKLWTKLALPLRLSFNPHHLDCFVSLSHYSPPFLTIPTIPTIHDLGYLSTPEQFTPQVYYQLKNWTAAAISRSSHLLAVSQFTKDEIHRIYHYPLSKISLVPNGVGDPPPISTSSVKSTLTKFRINRPFILCLGTLKPSKNIPRFITAFARFAKSNPRYQLVIAGKKGWLFDDIFLRVKKHHLEDKIIFTDYISESEKWSLLSTATCLAIPSLYEGFGIPAVEAMKIGTPVLAANIPPLAEVIDRQGVFVNPLSVSSIVLGLQKIISPTVQKNLRLSGPKQAGKYTWDSSALQLLTCLESLPDSR